MAKKEKTPGTQKERMTPYEREKLKTLESNAEKMRAKGFSNNFLNKVIDKYAKASSNTQPENLESVRGPETQCGKPAQPKGSSSNQLTEQCGKPRQDPQQTQRGLNMPKDRTNFCAPGSMAKNAKLMKLQSGRGNQSTAVQSTNTLEADSSEDVPGTTIRYEKMRKNQLLRGSSNDVMNDMQQLQSQHGEDFPKGAENNQSEDVVNNQTDADENNKNGEANDLVLHNEKENAPIIEEKKRRGKTILAKVHSRTMESRDAIILNDKKQPVGPTKQIVSTFSHFLGTLARDSNFAPLNYKDWRDVPTKEKIWEYVQKKFIVPNEGKSWVLGSVGSKWRAYKGKVKEKHYSPYTTMAEMLANRPNAIPKEEFIELMQYFASNKAKEISKKNKENRTKQSDMHTLGPVSYALNRHLMQQNDPHKQCPSEVDVYTESRKRVAGRTYLTQNEETLSNIEKMKSVTSVGEGSSKIDKYFDVITKKEHNGRLRMHGLGVTKSSFKCKDVKTPFVLPEVFLEGIAEHFNKKMEDTLISVFSKLRDANPGVDIVIPNFSTNHEDGSTSHESSDNEEGGSTSHGDEVMSDQGVED